MRRSGSWLRGLKEVCLKNHHRPKIGWFIPLVLLVLAPAAVSAEGADLATEGPKLFTAHKCILCHGVETAQIAAKTKSEKLAGPDLSAHEVEDFEALAKFLRKQEDGAHGPHKKEFEGTDEELRLILDWLATTPAKADAPGSGR